MKSNRKHFITTVILLLLAAPSFGQSIQWTGFDHLTDSILLQPKPILLFIHTDWCKYCKKQELTTFSNPEVTDMLNSSYYNLKLDAEAEDTLFFLNRNYAFDAKKGYHELACVLGTYKKEVIFPSTILFDINQQIAFQLFGLQSSKSLSKDLRRLIPQNASPIKK